jgi:RNA polymerase sigma-70 factor, ECF subfamily
MELSLNESDAELVGRAKTGDMLAFERLILRYERSVRSIAWAYLRESNACDDATQETFIAAYRSLVGLKEPEKFGPWLMQIARRTSQRLSNRSRIPRDHGVPMDEIAEERPVISDRQLQLLECIERLPENEQIVIAMRFFDGHSSQQIAVLTERPLGSVTKQLSRAYERLRKWLAPTEEQVHERK